MKKIIAAVGGGLVVLVMLTGTANAADVNPAASGPAPVQYTGNDIQDGSLYQRDTNPAVVDFYRSPKLLGIWSSMLNLNIVQEQHLSPAVRAKLNAPEYGKAVVTESFDAKTIVDVGGTFGKFTATVRATKLGEFVLPAGTYRIDAGFFAMRTAAGPAGTRPQLALRVDDGTDWGKNYGTVMGAELSPSVNRELTGVGFKTVEVTEVTTVQVFGFGYNDDSSAAGSGQFTMQADVSAVLVG